MRLLTATNRHFSTRLHISISSLNPRLRPQPPAPGVYFVELHLWLTDLAKAFSVVVGSAINFAEQTGCGGPRRMPHARVHTAGRLAHQEHYRVSREREKKGVFFTRHTLAATRMSRVVGYNACRAPVSFYEVPLVPVWPRSRSLAFSSIYLSVIDWILRSLISQFQAPHQ